MTIKTIITPPAAAGSTTGTGATISRPRATIQRPSAAFSKNTDKNDDVRLNERIRVPQVRLIDENGGQVGIVDTKEALRMAKEKGLDLMEVAANANPPVCKITDYGKFKYEKKKQEQKARKNQVVVKVKEVQLRPNTDTHDLETKIRNTRGFLEEGDKVKITLMFRGREITHTQPGFQMMKDVIEQLGELAVVEAPPKLEGKKLILILSPNPQYKKAASKPKEEKKPKPAAEAKATETKE